MSETLYEIRAMFRIIFQKKLLEEAKKLGVEKNIQFTEEENLDADEIFRGAIFKALSDWNKKNSILVVFLCSQNEPPGQMKLIYSEDKSEIKPISEAFNELVRILREEAEKISRIKEELEKIQKEEAK
jgi:hypothetical protein